MHEHANDTTLLIGRQRPSLGAIDDCVDATTLTAWSQSRRQTIVLASTCKRWTCRWCGEQKCRKLAQVARLAKPNKLITLTVNPSLHASPREAFDSTAPKLARLNQRIRRKHGECEYLRVLEVTRAGWPHYHLVARSSYIPQHWLSDEWNKLTGAPIVDIRSISRNDDVYWYVMKYLGKQRYIPWTTRRVTLTRNFAVPTESPHAEPLDLIDIHRTLQHPASYFAYAWPHSTWERIGPLAWALKTSRVGEGLPLSDP